MALSGSLSNAFRTGYRIQIDWSATQDVASNTSLVTANFYLISTGSSYSITSSAAKTLTITIDGTTFTHSVNVSIAGDQTKWLASSSKTIAHNADGTRDFAISGALGINVTLSGTYWGTVSIGAVAFSLNTIPRATTPTLSAASVNMGTPVTIYTNRASSAFTHTLRYEFNGVKNTIATGVATGYTWIIPLALASYIPNAASGVCYIACDTYNGSTCIGTKWASFTIGVPSSVIPTISNVAISEATDGIATKFAGFVQNKSKLNVAVTAAGAYGSTIQSYTTTILGINYSGASITSGILSSAGSVAVVTTVTDSRGRQVSITNTITVIAYDNPSIAAFSAQRCNVSGTPNDEGTSLLVNMTFSISAVNNKNDKAYLLEYKTSNAETWSTLTSGNVYTFNSVYKSLTGLFNGDNSYNLRLTLTDYFGTASAIIELPTAFTLVDFSASGKGIAFGQVATGDGFTCDLPTVFTDKCYLSEADRVAGKDADARVVALENMVATDWIIESGGDDVNGYYEKWSSGKLVMWNRLTNVSLSFPNAMPSSTLFYGLFEVTLPITPITVTKSFVNVYGSGVSWGTRALAQENNNKLLYTVIQYGAETRGHFVDWEVKGTWK